MCHQLTAYKVTTVIKWIIVSTWTRQESTTKGTYSRLDMLNFTPAERERECFKDRDAYKGNLETEWGNTGVFNGSHALWDVSSRLKRLRGVSTSGSHVSQIDPSVYPTFLQHLLPAPVGPSDGTTWTSDV